MAFTQPYDEKCHEACSYGDSHPEHEIHNWPPRIREVKCYYTSAVVALKARAASAPLR
jgi:hypothetical protein